MSNKLINYIGVFKTGLHPMRCKVIKGAADGKALVTFKPPCKPPCKADGRINRPA